MAEKWRENWRENWEDRFEVTAPKRLASSQCRLPRIPGPQGVARRSRDPIQIARTSDAAMAAFAAMLLPLLADGELLRRLRFRRRVNCQGVARFSPDRDGRLRSCRAKVDHAPLRARCFDLTICHLVLMHVPNPEQVLREMIRVTKPGGLIITCDANRNAHNALLHIEESNEQENLPLELFQTVNREHPDKGPAASTITSGSRRP